MKRIFDEITVEIDSWQVLVIGHLKWNPYFGESQEDPPRGNPSTCTSTLLQGKKADGTSFRLIVDPTLRHTPEDYYFDLNRRTGLQPEDITHCYTTHEHFDHQVGLKYFPGATWLAAQPVAAKLYSSEHIDGTKLHTVSGEFLPGLYAIPLPGHTRSLHGVACKHQGKRIVVAADAIMTRDHFANNTCMFEEDKRQASQTIAQLKEAADIVIPGHDNVIFDWPRENGAQRL